MDDKIFETFQAFCQYGTRAGVVPTHEAFAFLAVHGSGIEPKPGFPGQAVFQFGGRRGQCAAVHPHQISTLQFANRKVRKVFRAELFHVPVIAGRPTVGRASPPPCGMRRWWRLLRKD